MRSLLWVCILATLATMMACGGSSAPPPAPAAASASEQPSSAAPSSASAKPSPSASAKPAPAPQVQLPPHGASIYQLKFEGGRANVTPRMGGANPSARSGLDKVEVVDGAVELNASPRGVAQAELTGVMVDNFVMALKLRPITGRGAYSINFRRASGNDYPYLRIETGPGTVGLVLGSAVNNQRLKSLADPVLQWPKAEGEDVSVVISALGPEVVAYVNGTEALRTKDAPTPKGPMAVVAFGPTDGDLPFISRITELEVFAPDSAALEALNTATSAETFLPPHGDLLYELKPAPPSANMTPQRRKPEDKVEVRSDSIEVQASPGGQAGFAIPELTLDNFVASIKVQVTSGEGAYVFLFHGTAALSHSIAVSQQAGNIAITRSAATSASQPSTTRTLFGPEPRLTAGSREPIALAVTVQGPQIVAYLNGKEAARADDPASKGGLVLSAVPSANAKAPLIMRVLELKIFQPPK